MSEFVMVKRGLLEDLLGSAEAEAAERRAALGDFRPKVQAELDRVVADTRAVLAQEAGHVEEPVGMAEPVEIGYIEHSREFESEFAPVINRLIWTLPPDQRHLIPQRYKVMLYTSPPAPVSVVLPEQKPRITGYWFDLDLNDKIDDTFAKGWNACLDKVKELNQ